MNHSPAVDRCLEILCGQGCRAVRGYLDALQEGQAIRECVELNPQERLWLQQELENIMTVYDRADSSCAF